MEKRQITEKELKIAAKQCRMQVGVIDYLILKVRENQRNSQIKKFEFCHRLENKLKFNSPIDGGSSLETLT